MYVEETSLMTVRRTVTTGLCYRLGRFLQPLQNLKCIEAAEIKSALVLGFGREIVREQSSRPPRRVLAEFSEVQPLNSLRQRG